MPGVVWSRTHATIDSLGARDQLDEALRMVVAARSQPHVPSWLTADLAATETALRSRVSQPDVRRSLADADAMALGSLRLVDQDSLTAAYDLAWNVFAIRARAYGASHPDVGRARMQLSMAAFQMGRSGEADSLAQEVLAHLPAGADSLHPLIADAEQMRGRVVKNFSGARFRAEALVHYERALAIRTRTDGAHSLAVASLEHDLGNLERQAKRVPQAIEHLERALAIRRDLLGPRHEDVASTYGGLAWLAVSQGDWPAAERRIRESLDAMPADPPPSPSMIALRYGLLGQALRRTGQTREAIVPLRTAVAAAETMWARIPHDGAGSVSAGLSIHRELGLALAAEGRPEEAFEQVERSQVRLWAHDIPDSTWSGVLGRVQRALTDDAALILWPRTSVFPPGGDYPMWGCVVRRTGPPAWVRIERTRGWSATGRAPREALSRELNRAIHWPMRVSDTRVVDSLGSVLGAEMLTPLEPHLHGVSRLIVSGPDLMSWTPLGTMRDAHGVRLDDRFTISYVPSGLAYADLCERSRTAPPAAPKRALLVGAPDPGRDDAQRWPRLPGATEELQDLARLFPDATVLTGRNANAARLEAMARNGGLDPYGVVHFAAHIDLDPSRVLESAFVLSPDSPADAHGSRLTAVSIARNWHIHARLVSLAGCSSALGVYSASEGYLGMHSAFLAAGAPCVLVSLWQVDDEATRLLMREFHTRLLAPNGIRDAAQALRAAQRAVREYRAPDGTTPFAHPAYWAGFALVGRG